uniref:Uncharacterized protein n=1 Tax=Amphimedon queenslandica TaxID=400682 RepID=A0A1X7U9X6_AMPQE
MWTCITLNSVVQYCTKYVTKSETLSQSLRDTFANIAQSLKEGNKSVKVVQKLLINSFGGSEYSTLEICQLLLQLPMYKASRSFFTLGLDGSRGVEDTVHEGQRAIAHSVLGHCMWCRTTPPFHTNTIRHFTGQYTMPKELGDEPKKSSTEVIVTPRPYCSPEPSVQTMSSIVVSL